MNDSQSRERLSMRPWPTQVDFQDALQNPGLCFLDPDLQIATAADLTPFGLPAPISGQFANVYRFRLTDGTLRAVRLFIGASNGRDARYAALEKHLRNLPAMPPFLTPIRYQEEGILVKGGLYPMIRMPWIEGLTLNSFVDAHLYETARISALAEDFRTLVRELAEANIAHGDLQHGNLLVEKESGAFRLIDYDGIWLPELDGAEAGEIGHPAYQHPRRTLRTYGPLLDRFSALVIYAALRVLVVAPNVWFRLDNGDNLLFRRDDFLQPRDSEAFRILRDALLRLPDEMRLVEALQRFCELAPSRLPDLETVLQDRRYIAS